MAAILPETRRQRLLPFGEGGAYLQACSPQETACLVLEVAMPDLDGLELQRGFSQQEVPIPILFLAGDGDDHPAWKDDLRHVARNPYPPLVHSKQRFWPSQDSGQVVGQL